jgi:hypothetical protein
MIVVGTERANWYDTYVGISNMLHSLDDLKGLIRERCAAYYDRKERMNGFWILNGRFHLNTCGNVSKVTEFPSDLEMPLVISDEEFRVLFKQKYGDEYRRIIRSMGSDIPKANQVCPYCGIGWDIDNCHDVVSYHSTEVIPLMDYSGLSLGDIKTFYSNKTDAIYRMTSDRLIRNDKYIDLSSLYPDAKTEWEREIVVSEKGWINGKFMKKNGVEIDDYNINPGDYGFFNVWKYFHKECNRKNLAFKERKIFYDVFKEAGFAKAFLTELKNEYCNCDICAPWYNVETEFGTIKIGWRKSVISIDWSGLLWLDLLFNSDDIFSLFKGEDVTKYDNIIHACGSKKAVEYLGLIRLYAMEKAA